MPSAVKAWGWIETTSIPLWCICFKEEHSPPPNIYFGALSCNNNIEETPAGLLIIICYHIMLAVLNYWIVYFSITVGREHDWSLFKIYCSELILLTGLLTLLINCYKVEPFPGCRPCSCGITVNVLWLEHPLVARSNRESNQPKCGGQLCFCAHAAQY